jgi:hypothetical protein
LVSGYFIAVNGAMASLSIKNETDEAIELVLPDMVMGVPVENSTGAKATIDSQCAAGGIHVVSQHGQSSEAARTTRLAPRKTRRFKASVVGFDFGKLAPNARKEYALVRPESKVDDQRLLALFRELGSRHVHPFVGQAIARHLTADKSWIDLSHGGPNSRTIASYLGSTDSENRFCPVTLSYADQWGIRHASLASKVDSTSGLGGIR